jgi:hypothetical protein
MAMMKASAQNKPLDYAVEEFLTAKWYLTKKAIVLAFVNQSATLLESLRKTDGPDNDLNQSIVTQVEAITQETVGRQCALAMSDKNSSPLRRALWQAANEVCPDAKRLAALLLIDAASRGRSTQVTQQTALGRVLGTHLYRRRIEATRSANDGRASEHQSRAWSKLARISRELLDDYFRKHGQVAPPGYRCSRDHFLEICARIQERFWNDAVIGTFRVATIELYMLSHCEECTVPHEIAVPGNGSDEMILQAADVDPMWTERLWSTPPLQEIILMQRPILERCFESLSSLQKRVLDLEAYAEGDKSNVIALKPQRTLVSASRERKIAAFCAEQGIDRNAFDQIRMEALEQLDECLTKNSRKEWQR